MNNDSIIRKAAITTSEITSGLLNPEQSAKFLQQTFEATTLGNLVRHEMRVSKTGEIDKIGVARRLLREKTENLDNGYRAGVNTSAVKYATTAVRLPWELTGETIRENIERENFEQTVTDMMTTQLGIDLEDIYLNGDTEATEGSDDYDFIKINDGWIKQIQNGGHVYDATSAGELEISIFYNALGTLPNKYNNGKLRWLMSPSRAQQWEMQLLEKVINSGGAVPDNVYTAPARIPVVECPSISNDVILLTDPQNLIVVNTYDTQIRKTTEGEAAIMLDKIFYAIHLDFDPIIEELDATAAIKL